MFCRACAAPLDETGRFCPSCGADRFSDAAAGHAQPQADPGFTHFLRFLGVSFALSLSCVFLVGLFWMAHLRSRTGYRKRDILSLVVPYYGAYVSVVTLWRYTARDVYWTPRDDRPSDVLRGWQRPAAIAAGWVLFPVFTVLLIVAAALASGWSDAERTDLVNSFVQAGVDRPTAECMADEIIDDFPAGSDAYADDDSVTQSFSDAVDACAPG